MSLPVINLEKCTRCHLCVNDCPSRVINGSDMSIEPEGCIRCGHCQAICPVEAVTLDGFLGEKLTLPDPKTAEIFLNLIKRRRSIRSYQKREVDSGTIQKILDCVYHAPTGTNSRKVQITVVTGNKVKELSDQVMHLFERVSRLVLNPVIYAFMRIILGKKIIRLLKRLRKHIRDYFDGENRLTYDAPLLFVFHVPGSSSTPEQDGILWATVALYYAEALGLGTCYNGFLVRGINMSRKIKKFLGIPKENKVYETLTAGYPAVKYQRTTVHEPVQTNYIE